MELPAAEGYTVEYEGNPNEDITGWLQRWAEENKLDTENRGREIADTLKSVSLAVQAMATSIQALHREVPSTRSSSTPPTSSPTADSPAPPAASTGAAVPNRVLFARPPTMPHFRGNVGQDPISFLEDFGRYCRRMRLPEESKLEEVQDCLRNPARFWADIYSARWKSFEDFRRDFIEQYWSQNHQAALRQEISNSRWVPGKWTMAQHFAYFASRASRLTNRMVDEVLITTLMQHFPPPVQSLWQVLGGGTVTEAYDFLGKHGGALPGGSESTPSPADDVSTSRPRHHPYQQRKTPTQRAGNGNGLASPPGNQPKHQ